MEAARRKIDLVVISVLLDAGAGAAWQYQDTSGVSYSRSEGLAVASYDMFKSGLFSADGSQTMADADGVLGVSAEQLAGGFQISGGNPMEGVEGRLDVVRWSLRPVRRLF
eukprot:COSAG01_NODE_3226_length_6384_cov_10.417979_2_plen_110_part_00